MQNQKGRENKGKFQLKLDICTQIVQGYTLILRQTKQNVVIYVVR